MENYFLLEVGVEELPSRFVESTLTQIKENLEKSLKENRVEFKDIEKYLLDDDFFQWAKYGSSENGFELESYKLQHPGCEEKIELAVAMIRNMKVVENRKSTSQEYKMQSFDRMMNKLQQEVLMLYTYDENPDDISPEATLNKGLDLIAKIPEIVCYAYRTKVHYFDSDSLFIHPVNTEYSIAENILQMLRIDRSFTKIEASVLDMCLVLHADHGGGNNSTFTNVVMSSTGTDIYSCFAGAIGSLKGPKHGGANLAVAKQMELVIDKVGLNATDEQLKQVIKDILDKKFNDQSGLIYGIGHAVYTLSDPRCQILSKQCKQLAIEKNRLKEYELYHRFEELAVAEIKARKGINVCANIDFYSGLVYDMLGLSKDLYTLMFVIGRSVGWVAHNIENKLYSGKIIPRRTSPRRQAPPAWRG